MPRGYRLGRRRAAIDRTSASIVAAARELIAAGDPAAVTTVARRAGVSRATVYNRFGGRAGLLTAIAPAPPPAPQTPGGDPMEMLRLAFGRSAAAWAAEPALYRHLQVEADGEQERQLAEHLAAADALRPGCSIREAEDVIAALLSFPIFDRLHRGGRRTPSAVADVLVRLAGGILA
jgi:AcrR family transcriptional regulator